MIRYTEADILYNTLVPPNLSRDSFPYEGGDGWEHRAVGSLRMGPIRFRTLKAPNHLGGYVEVDVFGTIFKGVVVWIEHLTDKVLEVEVQPTEVPNFSIAAKKEDSVKIYEAVIVKLDEMGEPAEVIKVILPFVAKSDRAAQDQVLVDYARETAANGKDLARYSVRVRTFQATV